MIFLRSLRIQFKMKIIAISYFNHNKLIINNIKNFKILKRISKIKIFKKIQLIKKINNNHKNQLIIKIIIKIKINSLIIIKI